ncbi:MAG: riboflavin synthase [Bacteroidales bacterium]|jgi:riboflavin synthase|nr:riboflavin synthase [Bacteroidales bacterium]
MFSGIVECTGKIVGIREYQKNIDFTVTCPFEKELTIDQSVAHNGVCLTVVEKNENGYVVTAMQETLNRSNLGVLGVGDEVNLERSMKPDSLLDGHIVQGHVDQTGVCTNVEDADGSTYFTIEYDPSQGNITVEKGSVAVNGVSLTVCNSETGKFRVAIIPYTFEHTNFKNLKKGDKVNLEFDIIGKYIQKIASVYLKK